MNENKVFQMGLASVMCSNALDKIRWWHVSPSCTILCPVEQLWTHLFPFQKTYCCLPAAEFHMVMGSRTHWEQTNVTNFRQGHWTEVIGPHHRVTVRYSCDFFLLYVVGSLSHSFYSTRKYGLASPARKFTLENWNYYDNACLLELILFCSFPLLRGLFSS